MRGERELPKTSSRWGPAEVLFAALLVAACATPPTLHTAAYRGNATEIERLLRAGEDPNRVDPVSGLTPLMITSAAGHLGAVKQLLSPTRIEVNATDPSGRTALMFAARHGYDMIGARLIEAGADVDLAPHTEHPWPALSAATFYGHTPVVRLLVENGADIDYRDENQKTALQLAQEQGYEDVVEALGGPRESAVVRPDWIVSARLKFVGADRKTEVPAPPLESFYLWFPFIGGDLPGDPTTVDFVKPSVRTDYSVSIDLNKSRAQASRSLEISKLDDRGLTVEPREVRMARLATLALDSDSDEGIATTGWSDDATGDSLVIAYFDRACRISGSLSEGEHQYRFNVTVPEEGYFWLRGRKLTQETSEMVVSEKPAQLLLLLALRPRR